jgi:symplekin
MTPRLAVIFKSMERTTRALLRFVLRFMPGHPLEQKIHSYLVRLQQSRTAFFSDSPSLKRPAESADALDAIKRQRIIASQRRYPPLPPPPNTVAQLFTLTEDPAIQQFDVKYLPLELIDFTIPLLLKSIPQEDLEDASHAIRARYSHLSKASQPTMVPDQPLAGPTGIDDDDEYDPEYDLNGDLGLNDNLDQPVEVLLPPAPDLGTFELPRPPPLTPTEVAIVSEQSVDHLFTLLHSLDNTPSTRPKLGFNRVAASANDRDAWVTIILRIATRASSSVEGYGTSTDSTDSDEDEKDVSDTLIKSEPTRIDTDSPTLANRIRQRLLMYVLEDFRRNLNVAISWLNEEWYNDKVMGQSKSKGKSSLIPTPAYDYYAQRVLDHLLPYLDARDKNILIRFLSEIPALNLTLLQSLTILARDPERLNMFVLAMQYLLMFRMPVRDLVLDVLEGLLKEGDAQVQVAVRKPLIKYRPLALEGADSTEAKVQGKEGLSEARGTPLVAA